MGKLIAIDGLDGSGKHTQCEMLLNTLKEQGRNVRLVSFPKYESESSSLVRMYLRGDFGKNPDDVNAYASSTFYAVDRYADYMMNWKDFYEEEDSIIIADRYTTANAVHQLAKLDHEYWEPFLSWLFDFEYIKMGIPKPDLVIFLEMKPEISQRLVKSRSEKTGQKRDIHEVDPDYINRCYNAAKYTADNHGWKRITCFKGKEPLSPEDIHEQVEKEVTYLLDVGR